MIKKPKFYVYQHIYNDGVNSRIVYIGKGSVEYTKSKGKGGSDIRAHTFAHRNKNYTNFVNRVGKENIEVKIVARFDDESDALFLENELHEINEGLYSISDKQKAEIQSIPVVQLDLEGNFIREYSSMSKVVKDGFDRVTVGYCCRKKISTHQGFKWLYANEYYKGNYTFKENERNIPIVVVSQDGVYYFNSSRECDRQLEIHARSIFHREDRYSKIHDLFIMAQEEYNGETYRDLIIKYKIGIVQLDKDNNFVNYYAASYRTPKEFDNAGISACINKKRKSHKGYKWITLEEYLAS